MSTLISVCFDICVVAATVLIVAIVVWAVVDMFKEITR